MINAVDRLRGLRVADAMSRDVIVISSRQKLIDVARKFVEHDVTAAPVVDEEGRCVGFFSSVDALRRKLPMANEEPTGEAAGQAVVGDYMTRDVRAIMPGEPLLKAARVMRDRHLHRLPVVDDRGHAVGIISTMDIVAALINAIEEMDAANI